LVSVLNCHSIIFWLIKEVSQWEHNVSICICYCPPFLLTAFPFLHISYFCIIVIK
jgi:hypothetical protein